MTLAKDWFTETCTEGGSAFSIKIRNKLHDERTAIQHVEIYETENFGKLMVIDGFVMLTEADNFIYHEMISHPALLTHPKPTHVAIIGGGDCGTLRETLKHDCIEEVWQIEIDERVTRLAERFFPRLCESNGDPRARFFFGDGIQWMKQAPAASLDVIIIDSTDPIGPAEGLFSADFYRDCLRALRNGGIAVQQSESPLYHLSLIKNMRQAMHTAGFEKMLTLDFPQCTYPSGWWTVTMAGNGTALAATPRDNDAPALKTRYYNPEIHRAAQSMPNFLKSALDD